MKKSRIVISLMMANALPSLAIADEADWTGVYAGVYTGVNSSTTTGNDYYCWMLCSIPNLASTDSALGATVGVNVQVADGLVLGLEADAGSGGEASEHVGRATSGLTPELAWSANIRRQATVRARVGVTSKNGIAYVTAGAAFADYKVTGQSEPASWTDGTPGATWGNRWEGTVPGIVFGAGVERRFRKISLKFEVMHSKFSARGGCNMDFDGPTAGQCWNYARPLFPPSYTPEVTSVRVGANFHF